jgi:hypothetical protein
LLRKALVKKVCFLKDSPTEGQSYLDGFNQH